MMNDTKTDHEGDVEAIERIISDIETGFNTKDPDLSVEHFMENATAVSVAGTLLPGPLLDANRRCLSGLLRDQYARYEVHDVIFDRPPTWPLPTSAPGPPSPTASLSTPITP